MEELQSLMAALDFVSDKIGDGMYLDMADNLKRIHDKLNGNKPFHEDSFYYSDDDPEPESNSDYESDSEPLTDTRTTWSIRVERIREELLGYVESMHREWDALEKWETEVKNIRLSFIRRMTPFRKAEAIHAFCRKCYNSGEVVDDSVLVGCVSGEAADQRRAWTWERLVDNGVRAIVMEIGTEEEIEEAKRKNMHYDDLSLVTLQKLPAFEKKIYDDYKRESNEICAQKYNEANANLQRHKEGMQRWELLCQEQEDQLRCLRAPVYNRDFWACNTQDFFCQPDGRMVDTELTN